MPCSALGCLPWNLLPPPKENKDLSICDRHQALEFETSLFQGRNATLCISHRCPEDCEGLVFQVRVQSTRMDPELECGQEEGRVLRYTSKVGGRAFH